MKNFNPIIVVDILRDSPVQLAIRLTLYVNGVYKYIVVRNREENRIQPLQLFFLKSQVNQIPNGLVVRIPRSHRGGRGSIPRLGMFFFMCLSNVSIH